MQVHTCTKPEKGKPKATPKELCERLDQEVRALPPPVVIMGDFNAGTNYMDPPDWDNCETYDSNQYE